MAKKKAVMRLTVPGSTGYIPQVGGTDPVSGGSKVEDLSDVTLWLLTKLGDLHSRAKQIITDHLAAITKPPEFGGSGNA